MGVGGGGVGESYMKETGMFVVLLKGANHRFESNVGYSGQNTNTFGCQGNNLYRVARE